MFENSKWIWAASNDKKGDRIILRKKFVLDKSPKTAILRVSVSDSYNMYINGKMVIFNGGMPRVKAGCGFYEEVEIAKYLGKGDNVIGFRSYFNGNDYIGGVTCGAAGLILECEAIGLYSDSGFSAYRPEGFSKENTGADFLYFDAGKGGDTANVFEASYGSTLFSAASEFGEYGIAPYGELFARELPNFSFDNVSKAKISSKEIVGANTVYTAEIGEAINFAPVIEVTALGTESITIVSDRHTSTGGFYDGQTYTNGKIQYVCKNGVQEYESEMLLSGTKIIVTMPSSVKLGSVCYRKVYYNSEIIGNFVCYDTRIDKLFQKCVDTLENCLTTSVWDCPDRVRGLDLNALSAAGRAALYIYDDNILPLIKKSIKDFALNGFKNNPIGTGGTASVAGSLISLSEKGVIKSYLDRSGDKALMEEIYNVAADYLLSFRSEGGLLRFGDSPEKDGGYNNDSQLYLTCLYYSAVKFIGHLCAMFGGGVLSEKLSERESEIQQGFEEEFFKGIGYCSSDDFYDERANAMAVLAGLYNKEHTQGLISILTHVKTASAQTEGYVLEALIKLGAGQEAKNRLLQSYVNIFDSENPTMPENFTGRGALCYSGSVEVLNVLMSGFAGVELSGGEQINVSPNLCGLEEIKFSAAVKGGYIGGLYRGQSKNEAIIDNGSALKAVLTSGDKVSVLNKGKNKVSL